MKSATVATQELGQFAWLAPNVLSLGNQHTLLHTTNGNSQLHTPKNVKQCLLESPFHRGRHLETKCGWGLGRIPNCGILKEISKVFLPVKEMVFEAMWLCEWKPAARQPADWWQIPWPKWNRWSHGEDKEIIKFAEICPLLSSRWLIIRTSGWMPARARLPLHSHPGTWPLSHIQNMYVLFVSIGTDIRIRKRNNYWSILYRSGKYF